MDTPLLKRAYNLGLKAVPNFTVLTEQEIAWYEKHLDEIPSALKRGFVIPFVDKFALLVDLGIITVSDDYVHETRLKTFSMQNSKKFFYYNDEITDKNFPNPNRVLKPGDKLRVRAFKQVVGGTTTSEERMAFLATQKAIHTGAQGASLVFEEMRDKLPKGKRYASFDEKDRLWANEVGGHGVPDMYYHSDGDFEFDLGRFEGVWGDGTAFLCFNEIGQDLPDVSLYTT